MSRANLVSKDGQTGMGIKGIKRNIQSNQMRNQNEISSAFNDLQSLKEKSKGMVLIAKTINQKISSKELSENEMSEIQQVMFNMGMTDNFTSHVSKEISGKQFYKDLAREIEKFLDKVIESDRFSGVIGLIDLYCLYNRARGTDLVSPQDINIACSNLG